jgi:hypothetical protein
MLPSSAMVAWSVGSAFALRRELDSRLRGNDEETVVKIAGVGVECLPGRKFDSDTYYSHHFFMHLSAQFLISPGGDHQNYKID